MSAIQFEMGLLVMIKQPGFPAVRVVAGFATIAKASFMLILVLMALHTIKRCRTVILTKVAVFACSNRMHTDKWEAGNIVLKKHISAPASGVMTAIATLTQFTLVGIYFVMTAITV